MRNYAASVDVMLKWGILKEKVSADDLVTNELIGEIHPVDPARVAAEAKAYR